MPNWCWNQITIKGDTEALAAIDSVMKSADGDYHTPMNLLPLPKVLWDTQSPAPYGEFDPKGTLLAFVNNPDNPHWNHDAYEAARIEHCKDVELAERAKAETGFSDWYSWCVANWGTKWEMDTRDYTLDDGIITFGGESAWAPPIKLFQTVSEAHPTLTIRIAYVEEGMDYVGAVIIRNGELWESQGSLSTELPTDFDWDDDDSNEAYNELRWTLMDYHAAEAEILFTDSEQPDMLVGGSN